MSNEQEALIVRLAGPSTHIAWTPDHVPTGMREVVVLVRADALRALEAENTRLKADLEAANRAVAENAYDRDNWIGRCKEAEAQLVQAQARAELAEGQWQFAVEAVVELSCALPSPTAKPDIPDEH